jgi:glycosyltransferase involved in cell wall biosynthesis
VLAQTESRFEYLLVDDGSTDRTLEIAESYAARDRRITVLHGEHRGSSAARNIGLRRARGRFIAFCDGDDRWHPTFLERSLAALTEAPAEVGATFCAFSYIDEQGRPWGKVQSAAPGDYDAAANLAGHCPQGNGSCLLLRAEVFSEAGLFDEDLRNCVDLDMWLRIGTSSSTPLFRFLPEPLVDWRVRPGSISSSEQRRALGLQEMFRRHGAVLTPQTTAAAYTWPAVLAFYAGEDDLARQWAAQVRGADRWWFLRGQHGAVLGAFTVLGPRGGRLARSAARRGVAAVRSLRMAARARGGRRAATQS